ncbi:MAG: NAD-dependent epimerase [Planctomycetales bacterium]|nr:NAD-dependent epimerase [Planctomycetales bacterium]
MRILVTGAAGFIGMHVVQRLLQRGDEVVALDNLNDYYDVALKEARLAQIAEHPRFSFQRLDLADRQGIERLFAEQRPERVVHLAAQAGVRYSLDHPHVYAEANVAGFLNVLEGCRHHDVQHLVYASSSSVYGANTQMPFSVADRTDRPVSLYGATKKANELMAHAYCHLFGFPATGLRFFTVYGPWGRPDMALMLFTRAIVQGRPIDVFNHGQMKRDFTYIDDIVEGVVRVLDRPAAPEQPDGAPHRVYNIGNHQPVALLDMIQVLERELGREAEKNMLPMAAGDVPETYADVGALAEAVGFSPDTPIEVGIARFVEWYREYYGLGP